MREREIDERQKESFEEMKKKRRENEKFSLVWFICLMAYQLLRGYLTPKFDSSSECLIVMINIVISTKMLVSRLWVDFSWLVLKGHTKKENKIE